MNRWRWDKGKGLVAQDILKAPPSHPPPPDQFSWTETNWKTSWILNIRLLFIIFSSYVSVRKIHYPPPLPHPPTKIHTSAPTPPGSSLLGQKETVKFYLNTEYENLICSLSYYVSLKKKLPPPPPHWRLLGQKQLMRYCLYPEKENLICYISFLYCVSLK